MNLHDILANDDKEELRTLFAFSSSDPDERVLLKFQLWGRKLYPKYFKHEDAPYHADIDSSNLAVYRGNLSTFVDIIHRGGAKTTRTKLFWTFAISNDLDQTRKYFKVLCKDLSNSKQIVTDIYNMLIRHEWLYPEIFQKSNLKTEQTMGAFTTTTGVKIKAGTVGTDQRGDVQEDARPDQIWFDDFETRKTLRSAVETKAIWDNMEEARTGLSKDGGCIYTCNYLTERGNVHRLVAKRSNPGVHVLIQPICDEDRNPYWDYYTKEDILRIEADAEDFAGEYLCEPSAGADVLFDRNILKAQPEAKLLREVAGLRIFHEFEPGHRYGAGADIGGGVGLDSSTSVWIDFETMPARVVATYNNNLIKPDDFGWELQRQGEMYGYGIIAPENNKFDGAIAVLKQQYKRVYKTEDKRIKVREGQSYTYGWNTNAMSKPKMLYDLKKAIEDGHLELSDPELIAECMSYSRDDLMDKDVDPRLVTRHYDLLIALAISWQMKDHAVHHRAGVRSNVSDYVL